MSDVWTVRGLRWSYVAFISAASASAISARAQGIEHGAHGQVLAAVELLAALLFLIESFKAFACVVLVLVYVIATKLSLTLGDYIAPLRFIYYAATAVGVVILHRNETPTKK